MITKPPGWPFLTALSVLACLLMYWASVPHWYTLEMFLAGLLIGGPLMLHWTIRLALAGNRTTTPLRPGPWLMPWLIVAGVVVALAADAPFWLRFTLSKPGLEAYARTVTAEAKRDLPCEWAGLYRICHSFPYSTVSDGTTVRDSACLIGEEWAIHSNTNFVLLPVGEPEETYDDTYRHLTGNWYGWHGWDNW